VAITVNVPTGPTLVSIAISPATPANLVVGQTQQFTATGTYSDNSTKDVTTSATWASDNTAVATIGANTGVATGVAAGTANITATVGAIVSPKVPLTVVTAPTAFVYATNTYGLNAAGSVSEFNLGTGGALAALSTPTVASGVNPLTITTDPAGKYAYVTNQRDQTVGEYTINAGILTPMSAPTVALMTGAFPRDVKVDPSGKFVYVTDQSLKQVEGFTINADGSLTAQANSPWGTASNPYNLAFSPTGSPNGQVLYVSCANSPGTIYAFTIGSDGSLTKIGPSGGVTATDTPEGIAVTPNGAFLYAANSGDNDVQLFTIASDGTLTAGNTFPTGGKNQANTAVSIAITPDGKYLYVTNSKSSNVSQFVINADGSLTAQTTPLVAAGDTPVSIALDPTGTYAYVGNLGDGTITEYTISNGALTMPASVTSDTNGQGVTSVAVAP
jgi:YVTN family beta-propeller protein